jgi:hypothetical protein
VLAAGKQIAAVRQLWLLRRQTLPYINHGSTIEEPMPLHGDNSSIYLVPLSYGS